MIYPFVITIGRNFTFNPIMDGLAYQATITWNVFRQGWYFNLYNLNGNLIVSTALVSSDDQHAIESITWDNGVVTVTTALPHFMNLGIVANLNISGNSPDGFNGVFACNVTGPDTFTYLLDTNPGQQVVIGYFGSIVDLTHGHFTTSTLTYYANSTQFVSSP